MAAFERSLKHFGFEVMPITIYDNRELLRDEFLRAIKWQPDFALGYAHHGIVWTNETDPVFRRIGVPLILLHYDCPFLTSHPKILKEYAAHPDAYFHFIWDRAYLEEYKRLGIKNAFPIMLATDPNLFSAQETPPEYDVAFVGSIASTDALRATRHSKHSAGVNEVIDRVMGEKIANPSVPVLDLVVRENTGGLKELVPDWSSDDWIALFLSLHAEGTAAQRVAYINAMTTATPHVFSGIAKGTNDGSRVIHEGPVDYNAGLPATYRKAKINLNISAFQLQHSLNNRIFDAAAAGAFLLTDHREDLANVWSGFDAITYHSVDQLNERVAYYLNRDRERREIAEELRRAVLENHTYVHRTEYIYRTLVDTLEGPST